MHIVLHHTATSVGASDGADIVRSIENTVKRVYGGRYKSSYHKLVGPTGKVFDGQPIGTTAPHCGLDQGDYSPTGIFNQNSIAICAIGNFQFHQMPDAQKRAIANEIRRLRVIYPKGLTKLHRELVSTACPGINYPYLEIFKLAENKPMKKVVMTIKVQGNDKYNIEMSDGKKIPITGGHPVVINESIWLPLRALQQAMRPGAEIKWDAVKKIATITWEE